MESLKTHDQDTSLFKCADLVMAAEHGEPRTKARLVHEFFTGFTPLIPFVALQDKFCDYFHGDKKEALEYFVEAFATSHMDSYLKHEVDDDLKNRFDGFRLTIFPIGSYEKRWFMKNQHMNPDDAVKAHLLLNSQQSMGMHYATFLEHPEQAIDAHEKDLAQALNRHGVHPGLFWVLKFGEGKDVSRRIVFK